MTYQPTVTERFSATVRGRGQGVGPAPFLTARRALAHLGAVFSRLGGHLVAATAAAGRVHQVEALQAKTDEELSQMGIKREDIVRHVFKDIYYVL